MLKSRHAHKTDYSGRKLPSTLFLRPTFDGNAARAYGWIHASEIASGRKARGARALDLLIAATACAENLSLYTRDPEAIRALRGLVDVVEV